MPVLRSVQKRGVREPDAPLASNKKEPVRTMSPEIEAYNLDNVSKAAPLTLDVQPAPVIETSGFVSPEPIQQAPQVQAPVTNQAAQITAAGEAGNLNTELANQRSTLEGEIKTLQETMSNQPQAQIDAKKRMGIYEDERTLQDLNEKLSTVKQDLLAATDRGTELQELGRQNISDAGGTTGDLGQLTNQDQRENSLNELALSRQYSRLGDATANIQASINANISAVQEKAQAEQAKIEFDINQRNAVLDRVIQSQTSILTSEQALRLEDRKQANAIELVQEKARLDGISSAATAMAGQGVAGGVLDSYISAENPTDRDTLNNELYRNGEIDGKTFFANKAAIAKEAHDAEVKQQEAKAEGEAELKTAIEDNRVKNLAGKAVIANADSMLSSINLLLDAHGNNELDNVLGSFDSSWFGQWTDKTKGLSAAIDHIFSDATVTALAQMKGNPSDKDMEVVEQKAKAGFDPTIDDPAKLAEILTEMKIGLEDAKLIEAQGIRTRNSNVNAKTESLEDLESLMEEEQAAVPETINFDKLVSIESGGKGYTALNQSSGAYGKYQVIPSTQQYYADKMGISVEEARTPAGQEKVFAQITKDNIASLERNGSPVNTVSVYLAHQQGAEGARQIASGNISPTVRRNLLANLPARYADMSDAQVIKGWGDVFIPQLT